MVLGFMKQEKMDIVALQESYLLDKDITQMETEWGGVIHHSEGTTKSKGVTTFFSKRMKAFSTELVFKTERIVISAITLQHEKVFIVNVYGPCSEKAKVIFLNDVSTMIRKHINIDYLGNTICLGDFNMVINNELDIIAGAQHTHSTTILFKQFVQDLLLNDVWRLAHSKEKSFTWSRNNPFIARRLDYIFVGNNVLNFAEEASIKSVAFSDHRSARVHLRFHPMKRKSPLYKMNVGILKDSTYINMMSKSILKSIEEYSVLNPHLKWEMIKVNIREETQQYCKFVESFKRNKYNILSDNLNTLEQRLCYEPENLSLQHERDDIKRQLELRQMEATKGASIRAGIKWVEEGERNTKFFLSLEKYRSACNTIYKLKDSNGGKPVEEEDKIMGHIYEHFKRVYEQTESNKPDETNRFTENIELPELTDFDRQALDQKITIDELVSALNKMKNGSSPGTDGIPVEFYKTFWKLLKDPLMDAYQYSFRTGLLSFSQRRSVITLLYKGKGLDREEIKHWRPISLTNVDYKILAKTLALRLQKVIAEIIHPNQMGFVKGRDISMLLRNLDDVIEYAKATQWPGIVLSIDYKAAFDTVSTSLVIHALRKFGFGDTFVGWVKTLLAGRLSCIKNGGNISRDFEVQRGVRQGCPLSPLLYIVAVELFALKVRQDGRVKGFSVPGANSQLKILQYADDTSFFLKDLIDFREILSRIKEFSVISGLHLNKDKSTAICPGSPNEYGNSFENITFRTEVRILGVCFSAFQKAQENKENWESKIEALEKMICVWSKRNLTILGKIYLVKSFGLSLFIYLMQSIGVTPSILNRISKTIFNFIWKKRHSNKRAFEKIKRSVMYGEYAEGGLNVPNIFDIQNSFYLCWIEKLLQGNKNAPWKTLPLFFYRKVGGAVCFKSNIKSKDFRGMGTIQSPFWRTALQTWLDCNDHQQGPEQNFRSQPLFNNRHILYKRNVLFLQECINRNILLVKDMYANNRIISLDAFQEKHGNVACAQLQYNVLKSALVNCIEGSRGSTHVIEEREEREEEIMFYSSPIGNVGRKGFLNTIKKTGVPHAVTFWHRKLGVEITSHHWSLGYKTTKETRLRVLQWKILHNIYPTKILLYKMKLTDSRLCLECKEEDYIEHFFFECTEVKPLWSEVENEITAQTGKRLALTKQTVLLGLIKAPINKYFLQQINWSILIAKMCISKYRYGVKRNIIDIYKKESRLRGLWNSEFSV